MNNYLHQLRKAKEEGYRDGVWDGMQMGFDLTAIALNHSKKFRFGKKRLGELEVDVQGLVDEIITTNDPYVNKVHIKKAVEQIRGKDWDSK